MPRKGWLKSKDHSGNGVLSSGNNGSDSNDVGQKKRSMESKLAIRHKKYGRRTLHKFKQQPGGGGGGGGGVL
jgi:hypothetical protein